MSPDILWAHHGFLSQKFLWNPEDIPCMTILGVLLVNSSDEPKGRLRRRLPAPFRSPFLLFILYSIAKNNEMLRILLVFSRFPPSLLLLPAPFLPGYRPHPYTSLRNFSRNKIAKQVDRKIYLCNMLRISKFESEWLFINTFIFSIPKYM